MRYLNLLLTLLLLSVAGVAIFAATLENTDGAFPVAVVAILYLAVAAFLLRAYNKLGR